MDSWKNKICKIFAIVMLNLYIRSATATNIDCNGNSFHCVNSTHFMICVDLGGGVSITVNDFVIQCPPTTVCGEDNQLECTYQMPTTTQTNIHPDDETKHFTTDTRIITTSSSDNTNTISSIDRTSLTGLFNENFNMIEVTTYPNYVPNVQTYKNEDSGNPEILNNDKPLTNDHSNILIAMNDIYSAEILPAKTPEMHSLNNNDSLHLIIPSKGLNLFKKKISLPFAPTTVNDIKIKKSFSDPTDLNGNSSFNKLMDSLHDATLETGEKNASTEMNPEDNTLKDKVIQFTQKINSTLSIKSLPEIIATTETTLLTHYPRVQENHDFENSSTKVENSIRLELLDSSGQKIHERENIFTSVNLNDFMTKEDNLSESSFFRKTEKSNFNNTRIESKIELTTEADLIGPITQNINLINTLTPYELNVSETTVTNNFTTLPSTLEPTITSSEYVAETKETIVVTTESSTVRELEEETRNIKTETIFTSSYLNDNTLSPYDDDDKETTTITTDNVYSDHHTSTIDYQPTEQNIQGNKFTKSPSYEQHIPVVTVRSDFSTTHAKLPNLSVNIIINSLESTTVSSIGILQKVSQVPMDMSTSTVYPLSFNYNASNTENITEMEMNTTSAQDNYNSSYEIIIKTPHLNIINDQTEEIMVTEISHNTTEYNKLISEVENIPQITESPNSYDTSLSIENRVTKSVLYLEELIIRDNKTYTSTPHEQYKSELTFLETIPTTNHKTRDFSVTTESLLSNYDFTTTSLISTSEQATEIEQGTDRKEAIEKTTVLYTNLSENENATEKSPQVALNSTHSEYHVSDITNLIRNETIPTFYYDNSTYKLGVQNIIQKVLYDTQIGKAEPLNNLGAVKDSIYYASPIESITEMEMNTTSAHDNNNLSYEIMISTPQLNINDPIEDVMVTEISHNTNEYNKLISQDENILQMTETPYYDTSLGIENRVSESELDLEEQIVRDNKTYNSTPHEQYKSEISFPVTNPTLNLKTHDFSVNTESSASNYDFTTTSLLSTFAQATEIEQVTDRKEAIERITVPYHNTVPYTNFPENENATEKSPAVALISTHSVYRISDIIKLARNGTTPTFHYDNSSYKLDVQNIMQNMLHDTQIGNTKPLNNFGAIKDSIYYASHTESITEMEMNTTSARDNNNLSYEIMISTQQLNTNDQIEDVMVTETSHNTTEYNIFVSQDENIPQMTENPNSYDTSLTVENRVSKSELDLDQIIGDNKTYTSTPYEQYKSDISFPVTNPTLNHDFSVNTESSAINYDLTTTSPLSTFAQDRKEAKERITVPYHNTVPYTNLAENENATEKSPPVALNSTHSVYRVSDIIKLARNGTTPTFKYENSTYQPGLLNMMQKILYDTQIEKTRTLNNSGIKNDIIVTAPGLYNVISNIKVSESTTMNPELTPESIFDSVQEFVMMRNGQMNEGHPISNSDLSQDSWRDISSTSTENSITSENNTVDLDPVIVTAEHGNVKFFDSTANMTNAINNINNTNIVLDILQYKKPNEMVLFTSNDKFERDSKSYDTINEIYNVEQITTGPRTDSIPINTYTTEVTIQNQQTFNDTMKLTLQDHNSQTTEKSLWEEYNTLQTDISVNNDIVTSSTPSMTTLVTEVDEILSIRNQIITEVVTKNYLATDNTTDMVINTTNKIFTNNFIHVQDNKDSEIHVDAIHIEDAAQQLTDKLINDETEQYFTPTTIRPDNDTNKNTINKTLFKMPNEHYFSLNKSSLNLENFKRNEEAKFDIPLETNLNSNKIPPGIVENVDYTHNVTKKAKSVNVTDNSANEQSSVLSVNLPVQFYYNNDHDSVIITNIPISGSYSDLSHTALNNRTINNVHMKNEEITTTNEEQISIKGSIIVTTKLPTDEITFITDKPYADHKDRLTTVSTPLNHQIFLDSPSRTTSEIKSTATEGTDDLNLERNKANYTLKELNSRVVIANSTEHSNMLKIPILDLGSAKTVTYRPLVLVFEDIKQASIDPKLEKTLQKDDNNIHFNSTHESNYKTAATHNTKKDENFTIIPRVNVNVNKRIFATRNFVKIKSPNNTNVGMEPNKRSTKTYAFRCNYGSRGRFADKTNCRKYYICIGLNEPVLGECPNNTVFSEIKKQCTKNLSHCIRHNQFRCTQEGRFSDVLRSNIYYICVHYNNAYVRFQFQCQNGFHLNKTSVRCVKELKYQSQSQMTSISADSNSNKGSSDQSAVESKLKEEKQSKEHAKYTCKKEGKFPDDEDCRRYYVCTKNSKSVFRRRTKKCDSDEVFHREKKKCVDRDSYECN